MNSGWRPRLVTLRRWTLGPVHDVRAGFWAARELRGLRGSLARDGVRATVRRPPRRVSRRSGRVVMLVARVGGASCLERSLLRQAWLLRRGAARDVVIGVRSEDGFEAHAWLDGDPESAEYTEIHRITSDAPALAGGRRVPAGRPGGHPAGQR